MIGFGNIMSIVTVRFIRSYGHTQQKSQSFLLKIEAKYGDMVYYIKLVRYRGSFKT